MITVTRCTELPDSFDSLVDQSFEYLETGTTIDWRYMGNPESDSAKKEKLREVYQDNMDSPYSVVACWQKDGVDVHIGAGVIHPEDDRYIQWNYGVFGKDATGSKNFLHDEEYVEKTAEFVRDTLGLDGYSVSCQRGGSIYDYHVARADIFDGIELESVVYHGTEDAPDVSIATIKYRYLD
jgi:hypothetical protein|tara:strand:+ start:221 stop:763 length:543 start_codon:yes stop_codon:yes gene_type:complete